MTVLKTSQRRPEDESAHIDIQIISQYFNAKGIPSIFSFERAERRTSPEGKSDFSRAGEGGNIMKKLAVVGFLGLFLGIVLLWCPPAGAAGNVKFYLGGEGVYSFTNFKAGGTNTSGGFDNTGTDLNKIIRPGAHLGLELSGMVNIDFGFHYRAKLHFTTPSYDPTFNYETDVDAYSLMFSIYITPMPSYVISPYLGGGVGGSKFKMTTDDTVVNGTVDNISFAWQAEAGLQLAPTPNFALRIGYRYLNLGKSELDLLEMGFPAGNFTGDLTAHEIILGLRIAF